MKTQGKIPRLVTNELTVVNETPASTDTTSAATPEQATNETPAPVTATVVSATPAVSVAVVNENPAPVLKSVSVAVVNAVTPVVEPLTQVFNNAYNGGNSTRQVVNICDANRILPGAAPVMVSSLWSLVTKTPVTNSVDIVRQLANISINRVAACTAASKSMDLSVDYVANLGNYFGTVPVCNRTLRRNEMNDAYIRANMTDSAELGLDSDILSGAFTNSLGLKGIIGDVGTIALAAGTSLGTALGRLLPVDLANATIVIRSSEWFSLLENSSQLVGCCTVFVNGVPEMRYLGVRVVPSVVIPAAIYAVVGNFSRYIAGYDRTMAVTADTSKGFDEDKTYFKIQIEACGGSNATQKTVDGVAASSFVTIAADAVVPE